MEAPGFLLEGADSYPGLQRQQLQGQPSGVYGRLQRFKEMGDGGHAMCYERLVAGAEHLRV